MCVCVHVGARVFAYARRQVKCWRGGGYLGLSLLVALGRVGLDVLAQGAGVRVPLGAAGELAGVRLL